MVVVVSEEEEARELVEEEEEGESVEEEAGRGRSISPHPSRLLPRIGSPFSGKLLQIICVRPGLLSWSNHWCISAITISRFGLLAGIVVVVVVVMVMMMVMMVATFWI